MNKENHFIHLMSKNHSHIGDDGAYIAPWIYSKDIFFENVHFKRKWLSLYQIGYKAMIVNISDAIAMYGSPKYALVGIAIPKTISLSDMGELARGLRDGADKFNIEIVGGDTISNTKLDISITIISHSEQPLLRKGMKKGDLIANTGKLGESLRHLRYLSAGGRVHSQSRFVAPVLRQKFIQKTRRYLRCGMDISDGLFSDMEKLCSINRLSIHWEKNICKSVGCSGEEYEMLIAFSPKYKKTIEKLSKVTRTPLRIVGTAKGGKFINRCKSHHF
ncbi:MAG: thiamine-phosphate kinase [Sulfuricurvum sp.]|uniref:thiamine-phosphate kinase n=1 Tax=Sulfuricurvum sp. TaxID=2025608 RepID=UPI002607F6C6|nr:thiamine-phosphate kinase [Sulfuricurvum sp.]MDD2829629.1 thiamine-phosphate kinase [Sulfuricurvum sp.]MDD4950561.1 thiamine-phosphate kinase [Sulfuricurvum sp.]